jgi:hypothetical protein
MPNDGPGNHAAAIAELTKRIETAEANGDNDPLNRLADLRQSLQWNKDQLASVSAGKQGAKK